MSDDVSGVALVTGGGRGIGEGIARELAAAGMQVARARARARRWTRLRPASTGSPSSATCRSRRPLGNGSTAWKASSGPSICSSTTPGSRPHEGPLWEQDMDEWWRVFEVNVRGPMSCCHAVLPGMVERGRGRIVNVGSGGSYLPLTGTIARGTAVRREQGGARPFQRAPGLTGGRPGRPGLPDQPRPRPDEDDRAVVRRRRPVDTAGARRGSCACWRRDAPTPSPGGTSTPSTTTSKS